MLDSNKVINNLLSEDKELIKNAITEIKSEGDINIVPLLFEILEKPELHHTTEGAVATLLAEIKDPAFIPMLHSAINNLEENPEAQAKLVRVCWESTMNFSELLPTLCSIAIKGDFIVAMEATTAIEEQLRYADYDMLNELKRTILNTSEQNSPFAEEILSIIENTLEEIHSNMEDEEADSNLL